MAGVAKITKEQIWAAAEQLVQEGKTPTLAAVRGVVGGGSYTTISEVMSEFRAVQEQSDAPIKESLPPVLDEAAARMMAEVWSVAMGLANERLKAEREALDAARLEHERVQVETAEMADQLVDEIESLKLANDSLNEALETSREDLHNERLKVTQLQARLDVLEESMKDLRADKERLGRVNEEYAKEMREATIMAAKVEQLQEHLKRQEEVFKATILDYAATHGAAMSGKKPEKTINKDGDSYEGDEKR